MANRVVELYREFWDKCRVVVRDFASSSHNEYLRVDDEVAPNYESARSLTIRIPLKGCPCRITRSIVDIVVESKTIVVMPKRRSIKIVGACSTVIYFIGGIKAKEPPQVFRFEYHPHVGQESGDPLFHMQMHNDYVQRDFLPEVIRKGWCYNNTSEPPQSFNHIRVPTARMLFPEILYFLIADHWRAIVHELVKETKPIIEELNSLVYDSDLAGTEFWDHISASNWYCHAQPKEGLA